MNLNYLITILMFVSFDCDGLEKDVNYQYLMSENNIGPLFIGMDLQDVQKIGYEVRQLTTSIEGEEFKFYQIDIGFNGLIVEAIPNQLGKIYKLSTKSKSPVLDGRFSVGATLRELNEYYEDSNLVASVEGYNFNLILPDKKGVFVFDATPFLAKCKGSYSTCGDYLTGEESQSYFIFDAEYAK